jgi:hypothetical protein
MSKANETGRGSSFDAFASREHEYELISPEGESLIVVMRDVTADELLDATRDMRPPEVPLKHPPEFAKDANGKPVALTDPDNPAYLKVLMQFRQRQMAAQILKVWVAEVPGETDEEKIGSILAMPSWAHSGLWKICMIVTATSEDRIKQRTFRPHRAVEA